MKRIFCLAGALATIVFACLWPEIRAAVGLQSPTVYVVVSDFTLEYTPESRSVTLTPSTGAAARNGISDSDGQVAFANVTPGLYQLNIAGVGLPQFTLQVPNSSATLNATNLIISAWTPPAAVPYVNTNSLELSKRLSIVDNVLLLDSAAVNVDTVWTNDGTRIRLIDETIDNVVRIKTGTNDITDSTLKLESFTGGAAIHGWATNAVFVIDTYDSVAGLWLTSSGYQVIIDPTQQEFSGAPFQWGASLDIAASDPHTTWSDTNDVRLATLFGDGSYAAAGAVTGTNGLASLSTTTAVTIAATGWTNTFGKNAVVYYDGTNVIAKVYNNAGTAIYTNTAALSGGSILLQPSGAVILSGTGVNGRAAPF